MIAYLVYLPHGARADSADARLIADAFSWPAFVFPAFWLLFQRQWIAGVAVFVLQVAITYCAALPGAALSGLLVELALRLLIGLEGSAFIARRLEARGFTLAAILPAPDLRTAEEMYGAGLAAEPARFKAPLPRLTGEPPQTGATPVTGATPGLGVFDSYGSR